VSLLSKVRIKRHPIRLALLPQSLNRPGAFVTRGDNHRPPGGGEIIFACVLVLRMLHREDDFLAERVAMQAAGTPLLAYFMLPCLGDSGCAEGVRN
jgi:hypothetical protein